MYYIESISKYKSILSLNGNHICETERENCRETKRGGYMSKTKRESNSETKKGLYSIRIYLHILQRRGFP